VIERFLLPDWTASAQMFVYQMGRGSLNGVEDFGHRPGSLFRFIDQRNQDQVDVVGHYDTYAQIISSGIVVKAGVHDDIASSLRKLPALKRTEGHEVRLIVALQVRQASSIEGHRASKLRSFAPLGRPRAAVPT